MGLTPGLMDRRVQVDEAIYQTNCETLSDARVLVIAFSCHPDDGSEPGMAWNIIKCLSKRVTKLEVVTLEYRDNILRIGQEVKRLGLPVQFHYLPLGRSSTFHRWPLNYLIYNRWHVRAARLVDSLLSTGQ
ncbi:MAG: hypothetical protein KDA84_00210, partial [Planctomycetaceae bacterium]|nr:hypothetical protein [Planctomycetaceae bacterium]